MTTRAATIRDERPLLILVSSLSRTSREHFLESVAPRYRVWLFLGGAGRASEPSWESPYLVGHTVLDTLDAEAMTAEARRLAAAGPVRGVVCYDEARILATARMAEALGLPTSPPSAIETCRDKHLTRQALATAGVPQAQSVAVRSLAEGHAAAERIGYPVVFKPRNLAAGFGVRRADGPDELASAYAHARSVSLPEAPERFTHDVLVEEYLDGPEISVDSACFDARVVPLAVAHKVNGLPPSFEETGHRVDGADPLLDDPEFADLVDRAHRAVGFHTGMTHLELRRTAAGMKVVELNARLGGDLVPYLGQLATGVDLSLAAAAIACGQPPDLHRAAPRVAGIRFCYPEGDLTVGRVRIDEALLPPGVERAEALAEPGDQLRLPPRGSAWECRAAQVVAVADTVAGCETTLDAAVTAVTCEPADAPPGVAAGRSPTPFGSVRTAVTSSSTQGAGR